MNDIVIPPQQHYRYCLICDEVLHVRCFDDARDREICRACWDGHDEELRANGHNS